MTQRFTDENVYEHLSRVKKIIAEATKPDRGSMGPYGALEAIRGEIDAFEEFTDRRLWPRRSDEVVDLTGKPPLPPDHPDRGGGL